MLIDEYKALTSRNDFFIDHEQEKAILSFQELFDRLVGINSVSNTILGNIGLNFLSKRKSAINKGIYLYGGVGRGKTFIMDLFYKELPH